MPQNLASCSHTHRKTLAAFIWMKILDAPFWAIFNLLPFIVYKDLHATPLQITAMIILKPAVSLVALYWSSLVAERKDRLISNLVWARVLGNLPFFFFPFVDNPWFFVASFGFYMMLARGTVPAWMEVLKLNISGVSRERIYAYGSAFGYFGGAIIPVGLGWVMDIYFQSWRWMFPLAALISLSAIFLKSRIPIEIGEHKEAIFSEWGSWKSIKGTMIKQLYKPWKSAWELLWRKVDFAKFQLAFTIGGAGLAVMQPALPMFFMDGLHLSYTELGVAIALCKGIGFSFASPWWARLMNKINIFRFNGWVYFLAFLFPLCLIIAQINLIWLYAGYLLYGIMQAGNEMSWSLSGPVFAKEEDSSIYTSVNILTVGLRGCIVPVFGGLLEYVMAPTGIMIIGSFLCFLSTICMSSYGRQSKIPEKAIES